MVRQSKSEANFGQRHQRSLKDNTASSVIQNPEVSYQFVNWTIVEAQTAH